MKKVGYYPGCSLNGTAKEYEMSIKKVANLLDVELVEVSDWNCCGATSAHVTSHKLAVSLSLRNLILAAEQGIEDIMAPCAACYSRLTVSKQEVMNNPKVKQQIEEILDKKIEKLPNIINIVQFFKNFGIGDLLKKSNPDLKFLLAITVACLLDLRVTLTMPKSRSQWKSLYLLRAPKQLTGILKRNAAVLLILLQGKI